MNPDDLKQAWHAQSSQSQMPIDADWLLTELQRNQRHFTAKIFWRDMREVGIALLMAPLWIYLGVQCALPWTWYLTAPALLWIAGFMLAQRMHLKGQPLAPGESLRQGAESALAQVEHQIRLLRSVFWWGLLPIGLSGLAFFGQIAWLGRSDVWTAALILGLVILVEAIVLGGVYFLNQNAVRSELEPRRRELEALLTTLKDETPSAN